MPGCPIAQISCVRLLGRNAVSSGFIPDDETIADWTSRAMAETLDAQSSCCSRGPSIFYQIVTSAFGEKHCRAVSALQELPFNLQRQRLLLSQVFLDDEKDINTQLFVRVFDDGVDCFGLNHPIVAV